LQSLFENRNKLNEDVKLKMQNACFNWGAEIIRYEITDMEPVD